MKTVTIAHLTEPLTLLIPHRQDDGEGGWTESWKRQTILWACVWPLIGSHKEPLYRVVMRADPPLPPQFRFLWSLPRQTKRLQVLSEPILVQQNRFLSMIAEEEIHA